MISQDAQQASAVAMDDSVRYGRNGREAMASHTAAIDAHDSAAEQFPVGSDIAKYHQEMEKLHQN